MSQCTSMEENDGLGSCSQGVSRSVAEETVASFNRQRSEDLAAQLRAVCNNGNALPAPPGPTWSASSDDLPRMERHKLSLHFDSICSAEDGSKPQFFNGISEIESHGYVVDGYEERHENVLHCRYAGSGDTIIIKLIRKKYMREVTIHSYLHSIKAEDHNIVPLIAQWETQLSFIALEMPFVGHNVLFAASLVTNGEISQRFPSIIEQTCNGVGFLHEHLIAHLDLKPENIMVNPSNWKISIIDFGCAAQLTREDELIEAYRGTEGYIAPEIENKKSFNPIQADLFSCGRVFTKLCGLMDESKQRYLIGRLAAVLACEDPGARPPVRHVADAFRNCSDGLTSQMEYLAKGSE